MRGRHLILVVDDDRSVVAALSVLLEHEGYSLSVAYTAGEGLRRAYEDHPDLVLLDLKLPDQDGFTVLQRLHELTDVPILMLTASAIPSDQVRALDEGAVDYISKPFEKETLLARVRRRLRDDRRRPTAKKDLLVADSHLTIDLAAHIIRVNGVEGTLTPIEWRLLKRLIEAKGQVVTLQELLRAGWGDDKYRDERSIKVRISSIRKKIGDRPQPSRYIHTERQEGYRFEP